MNKEKNVQDSQVARHSSNEMCADVLCQILVDDKIRGIYLHSHQCTKKAVCVIAYKMAKKSDNIKSKKCCTIHKKMFLRQIDRDDHAELVSCENIG